jgi:hypothetical protein
MGDTEKILKFTVKRKDLHTHNCQPPTSISDRSKELKEETQPMYHHD